MPKKKLTARFVETVKTQGRVDYFDSNAKGLELRLTTTGAKTWAIRYRRNSDRKQRRLTLGRYPTMSLEEARIRAGEEFAAIARGADPASGVQEHKAAPTFRQLVREWQTSHAEAHSAAAPSLWAATLADGIEA